MKKIFITLLALCSTSTYAGGIKTIDTSGFTKAGEVKSCYYSISPIAPGKYQISLDVLNVQGKPINGKFVFSYDEFYSGVYRETGNYDLWYYFSKGKQLAGLRFITRSGIFRGEIKANFACLFQGSWGELDKFVRDNHNE